MMFSFFIANPTWIEGLLLLSLLIVLILKAKREEKHLLIAHSNYTSYRKETKLFIPYIL